MTATSAASDPLPPFYLGANYAPTSEEDEAWVPQAFRPRITKNSLPTRYGTHRTVAPPVEKFPSRPRDNRRHDDKRRHKPNRSAAAAIATPTAPAPVPTPPPLPPSSSYPEDAINRAFATLYDDLWALLHSELQLPMSSTPNPFRTPNQPTSLPKHSTKRTPNSTTTLRRKKPVDNNQQNRRNRHHPVKYSPTMTPQISTPMTTPTPFPLSHLDPPSPPTTCPSTSTAPPTTVLNTSVSTQTDTDPPLLPALTLLPPTMPQPPTPTSPSPSDLLPSPLPSATETPAPAIPSPPLNLSLVERLIYNNTPAHAALWTPDALNQHHVLN